ncbi:hypothetical protein [Phycicoccus sp.]|uniref:lipopolysaccharide biosynthesis protein n=1 Tax=Phycicoccus sp. TaxID=1902410 RepID=UPI002BF04784|nr:hypothetical protein [Phycicoccus sp.]HMM94512.1 hypothetical protein [Phycicoccus sp.]
MSEPSPARPRLRASAGVMAAATLGANVLVYGVFLVLARALTPADLGAFSALGNLLVIAGVPALALQLVTARHVARTRSTPPADLPAAVGSALRTGLVVGLGGTAVVLALAPVLSAVLDLPSGWLAVLLALAVLPVYLAYAAQGCLQGRERFVALGAVLVAVAVGRLAAAVVGGGLGWGVGGVLGLTVLASWLAAGLALVLVRDGLPAAWARARPTWVGEVLRGTTATAALLVVTNLDVPLARALLHPDDAGRYAVLAVLAKAAYWGPAFLATLLYPRMATGSGRRAALAAVWATAGIGVAVVGGAALLARPLVLVVGGERYAELAPLAPLFAAVGATWSVAQVLVYWRLSRGDHRMGLVVWTVAAVVVAVVGWRHGGIADVALPLLAGGLVVVAWGVALLVRHGAARRPAREEPGVSAPRRARSGPPRR